MLDSTKRKILQLSNVLALIITLIINGLSGTGIFNGKSVGEISDAYPNLFTPAGLTFSIWSVIYAFLIIFVIYQARDVFKTEKQNIPYIEQ
ncbi:MAG: tryptophan-rich sensory protein, partial [Promethearchaeota archaeon]